MTTWKGIAALLGLGMLLGMLGTLLVLLRPRTGESSSRTGPTIEQVQALAELVTMRVEVADVVVSQLRGYTGGVKAALVVKGDFRLGVDLSKAAFESIDPQQHQAVLVLPQPQVSSPRLDHERTRLYSVDKEGLWQIVPGGDADAAIVNQAFGEAQRVVADAGSDGALIEKSRHQAEQVLATFFNAIGWTVSIRWTG